MEFLTKAFEAIPAAASSGLAAVLYVVTIVAWVVIVLLVGRNKNLLKRIEKLPESERAITLRAEMGVASLREGLSAEQWLRSQIHRYYFFSFVIVIIAGVGLFLIAGLLTAPPNPAPIAQNNCDTALRRGGLLLSQGHLDLASQKFQQVTKECPKSEEAWRNLGLVELARKHPKEAFDAFKQALDANPKEPANKVNLAIAYLHLNSNEAALKILRELNVAAPGDVNVSYHLGLAYQRMDMFKEARSNYETVISGKRQFAGASAFNLAAEFAARAKSCDSSEAIEAVKLLQQSLDIAVNEGNTEQRMRRITGQQETENGEKLKTIRSCPQLKQLLTRYQPTASR